MASKVGVLLAGLAIATFAIWAMRSPIYERIWRRSTDWIASASHNRDPADVERGIDMVRRIVFGGVFVIGLVFAIAGLVALA